MTRYAVISDVHSNLEALEAVVADLEQQGIDRVICCGDLVGYGADPSPCIERAQELFARHGGSPCVLGNHDYAATSGDVEGFSAEAAVAAQWTRDQLSPSHHSWLCRAKMRRSEGDLLFTHSAPTRPEAWIYLWTAQQVEMEFRSFDERICFVGHTHQPFICIAGSGGFAGDPEVRLPAGARCIANVGSVGQPRDGDPRAAYCLYDEADRLFSIRRLHYDIQTAARKILQAGLPEMLAERLFFGY